jgi:hypothetical protein
MTLIITIEIDNATGNLTVEVDGEGKGCAAVQEAFATTLGKSTHLVSPSKPESKPEFNKV